MKEISKISGSCDISWPSTKLMHYLSQHYIMQVSFLEGRGYTVIVNLE
jgi:hypothetical protein